MPKPPADDTNSWDSGSGAPSGGGSGLLLKRLLWTLGLLTLVGGGLLLTAHLSGGKLGPLDLSSSLGLGGDEAELRTKTRDFWEHLQFKDYTRAAEFHSPDKQATVDIPFLIHRLFLVKPELLEFMRYEVLWVDFHSDGVRARSKSRVTAKHLPSQRIEDKEVLLYWVRDSPSDLAAWYMVLEDSLKPAERDERKRTK